MKMSMHLAIHTCQVQVRISAHMHAVCMHKSQHIYCDLSLCSGLCHTVIFLQGPVPTSMLTCILADIAACMLPAGNLCAVIFLAPGLSLLWL